MQSKSEAGKEDHVNVHGRAAYMGHSTYSSYSDYGKRPLSALPILPTLPNLKDTAVISIVATHTSSDGHGESDCNDGKDSYALETMKSATYSIPSSTATLVKSQDYAQPKIVDGFAYYGTYGTYGANRELFRPIQTQGSPVTARTSSIGNRQHRSYDQDQGSAQFHQGHQTKTPTQPLYSQEQVNEHQMRQWMRSADYGNRGKMGVEGGNSWWWWLSGKRNALRLPGGERGEVIVSVDAAEVERWEPGDTGPGVKESHLGRYDHWL
jgi:hypothetical protein